MPNRPKVASEVRTNDRIKHGDESWLVLEYATYKSSRGGSDFTTLKYRMENGEIDEITFPADQELIVI